MLSADGAGDFVFRDIRFHFLVRHGIGVDFAFGMRFDQRVGAVAALAFLTVHFGIGKGRRVSARVPHAGIHKDRRVNAVGVVALLYETFPPGAFQVVLDLHAHGTVIPGVAHAAVNFASGEDDAARLAKRHELIHSDRSFFHNILRKN